MPAFGSGDLSYWNYRATSESGWGTWIRTKTNRVRVCCATVTPFPNGIVEQIQCIIDPSDCGRKRVWRKSRLRRGSLLPARIRAGKRGGARVGELFGHHTWSGASVASPAAMMVISWLTGATICPGIELCTVDSRWLDPARQACGEPLELVGRLRCFGRARRVSMAK